MCITGSLHRLLQGSPHSLPCSAASHHETLRPALLGLAALHLAVLVLHRGEQQFAARDMSGCNQETTSGELTMTWHVNKAGNIHKNFQSVLEVLGVLAILEVLTKH